MGFWGTEMQGFSHNDRILIRFVVVDESLKEHDL